MRSASAFLIKCLQIVFLLTVFSAASFAQSYLSNLSVTPGDPVYTTYAAALERSEFIIDQGYQFVWYNPSEEINFKTDKAGNLSLLFKLNGKMPVHLEQMYREPVICASFSDLVKYYYYPFPNIRVENLFIVYSSRVAIHEVTIKNEGSDAVTISVYPFLNHENSELTESRFVDGQDGFTFKHREIADDWTKNHGIPYQENILNGLIIDLNPDYWGAYNESGEPLPTVSGTNNQLEGENYCVEWGLVYHADQSLCYHEPPDAQQIVFLNSDDQEILTESAPKWGDADPNIPGNGYQGCELGHFDNPPIAAGDTFRVIFNCLSTGEQGSGFGAIPHELPAAGGIRTDILLNADFIPAMPEEVQAEFFGGNAAKIQWKQEPGLLYSVYRRNLDNEIGEYDRLARGISDSVWYDFTLQQNKNYGYIVIARDRDGCYSPHSSEVTNWTDNTFLTDAADSTLINRVNPGTIKTIAMQKNFSIQPGEYKSLRIIRGVTAGDGDADSLINNLRLFRETDLGQFIQANENLYSHIPELNFNDPDYEMVYWNAFSMIRQCMLPPEGQCSYNYYVFSREPVWGWGHGGQVFHESLTMLAYVFMDPLSAMHSQRVYMERQWEDGYINYRTGPYLNETIPFNNQFTTSAPWYNWINWEIYQVSRNEDFLNDAYISGVKFYNYWVKNRNADSDSLCEWGAHAVLECVRDGQVAIWDQVGWPSNFEALDLNVMLVNEARSLAAMARELKRADAAQRWDNEAEMRAEAINHHMWDAQDGFYYHVDKTGHDFTFNSSDDLKRMEIIGFLPLWAGIASGSQAERLLENLTDPAKFWRAFGVPSLSADDVYYNSMGYWNGPVWPEWQYLIFRGLLRYGYFQEARQLVNKVFENVIYQLKSNHWFWELYSPDNYRAGHHKTYIWSGIIARMLIDLDNYSGGVKSESLFHLPAQFQLHQNYPNPFNSLTTIKYRIPKSGLARIEVFNNLGQIIKVLLNKKLHPGQHAISWNATDKYGRPVPTGIYYCLMRYNGNTAIRKMLLIK